MPANAAYYYISKRRGVENVLSDLSERLLGAFGHSLGRVLSESVSQ